MNTPKPAQQRHVLRRELTQKRNAKIVSRFSELYEEKRMRIDDVILELGEEFHLAPITIERILNRQGK